MHSAPHGAAAERPTRRDWPFRWALGAAGLLLVAALSFWWLIPELGVPLASYLPAHTLLEVIAVVVALLIFGVGWFAPREQQPGNFVTLATTFLAVGLLDLLHLLSYLGMPNPATPAGPESALFFWLAARLAAALGLLALAVHPWPQPPGQRARILLLGATLAVVALCSWVGLTRPAQLSRAFSSGQSITPLKIALEYGVAALYALAAFLLVRNRRDDRFGQTSLLSAVVLLILSELCFTLYSEMSDLFNLLGHLYKLLAYGFLYHAIFVDAVRAPYKALHEAGQQLRREQEALQASEELFRQAFAYAGIGKALVALDGRFLLVNPALCRITGYHEKELLKLTFQAITYPDDLDADLAQSQELVAGHIVSYEMEKRYIHKAGHIVWILLSGSLVRRPDGSPLHFIAQIQDISGRKQAEQALSASQEQLRLVLDGSDDGFWDWNVVSGAVSFSERWATMLGYRLDEIEPDVRAWERLVHPDDMAAVQAALAAHFAGETDQYVTEHRMRTRSGGWLWILDRGRVVERDADRNPLRMAGTHTDITARKRMEAELQSSQRFLQSALDALASHIAILDEDSTIITVNAAWRRFAVLNDLPDRTGGVGTNYLALCDTAEGAGADEAYAVAAGLRDVLAGALPAFEQEYRCDAPHEERWFLLRVTRFEDEGRVRLVVAHENTTRQRQAEAQVLLMNDQLAAQVSTLEHRTRELDMLVELNGMLRACRTTADAYAVLASFTHRLFPASDGVLYMRRAAEQALEAVVRWGGRNDRLTVQLDDCWAFRRGRPHLVESTTVGVCCAHLGSPRPASTLCLPLVVHGDTQGLLTLGAPRALSAAETQLAQAVTNQLELTLANLQLQESLRAQAVRDPLTGLFNRRYLEETLARMLANYRRNGRPFALLVADIDHFKQINDTYGHEAGDVVLRAVSQTLRGTIRAGDIACRYGGEEFVLVIVDVNLADARARAEELRKAVGAVQTHFHERLLPAVTISIGLALVKEPGVSPAALIARADAALYTAKSTGRDQLVVAQ